MREGDQGGFEKKTLNGCMKLQKGRKNGTKGERMNKVNTTFELNW